MAAGVSGMLQHFRSVCQVRPGIFLILSIRSRTKGVMIDRRPGPPGRTSIGRTALMAHRHRPPISPGMMIRGASPYVVLPGRTVVPLRTAVEPVPAFRPSV